MEKVRPRKKNIYNLKAQFAHTNISKRYRHAIYRQNKSKLVTETFFSRGGGNKSKFSTYLVAVQTYPIFAGILAFYTRVAGTCRH